MKRILFIFLLIAVISVANYAQTPEKPVKKVYRSETNRLFINKDLGVYLWLSTSPDINSEKHRLMSDSSKKHTNPMYFDTQGYNTLRSPSEVDTATRKVVYPKHDIIFEVYADGLPPASKAVYQYTTYKYLNGKKYYDSNLKIELRSYDAVSGIESIWFNLNSDTYIPYKEPLTKFKEGENILKFYATDKVGNIEEIHEEIFYLDNAPPKTVYQIEGNTNDKYVSADALIKLTSSDGLSGVKNIFYKINDGNFVRYSAPIPVKILANDQATISFYSEDLLGNKEPVQTIGGRDENIKMEENQPEQNLIFEFYIDRDPPRVSLDVNSDIHEGNYLYVSPRSVIAISAEDEKSGVEKIQYGINTTLIETEYKSPFSLENKGLKYIRFKATDYVGNSSATILKTFYCDPDPPKSDLVIGNPKFLSRDTLFVSAKTQFSLTGKDEGSGVASISYSINNSAQTDFTGSFSLDNNGFTILKYHAADNVNNKEASNIAELYVDNELPVIHHHFSVESIGKKVVRDENYTIYPTNVMLYIAVTDKNSGGEKIEYSINDGPLQIVNPVKALKQGNYLIEVSAYDVLGNKSMKEIKFSVE